MLSEFMEKLKQGWEGNCPTCGHYCKIYHRRIHTSMALQLIQLYKLGGENDFIHASKLIMKGVSGTADFSKLIYWGLIKQRGDEPEEDKKSSGYWKLTDIGLEFVMSKLRVKKYAVVYNGRVIDAKGSLVSIEDCLENKFSYSELMEANHL